MKVIYYFLASIITITLLGCNVSPSLTQSFTPVGKLSTDTSAVNKIIVMKPLDIRTHAGTTPTYKAYILFYPFVRTIQEPEEFTYEWNGYRYDYEMNFAELVAMDLQAAGIGKYVTTSPEAAQISPLLTGPARPDYIVRISIIQMDWQTKYTMYGLSVIGYLPHVLGFPNSYGFSNLKFSMEVLDSQGNTIAKKTFSATESENGYIYYFTGYLRGLTKAYAQLSPGVRKFVADSISNNTRQ